MHIKKSPITIAMIAYVHYKLNNVAFEKSISTLISTFAIPSSTKLCT